MDAMKTIESRHSVRSFKPDVLPQKVRNQLQKELDLCNTKGGLNMRLVCDEPQAFDSALAHYGKFSGVQNYFVLAGAPAGDLDERCGYYGERLALLSQELGLNTCWVALTFKKRYVKKMLEPNDKLSVVIALGYGATQGVSRKSKEISEVSKIPDGSSMPAWFENGVKAALLAPTAMNQQSFEIELTGAAKEGKPCVKLLNKGGAYSKVDLGIVRLHFELGAGQENFAWA